ncbi:MAG TPA: Ig-like domain-containing protein [Isosphaeraceae bacterium]|jgi:hypothetical protein|nr:Ig-like domain-containing protein [Isosphaeraceae bacterium]
MIHRSSAGRRGPRARPRLSPTCEAVEPRALLAAIDGVTANPIQVTNDRNPTLSGTATQYSVVQVFGQRAGDGAPRLLGQTEADPGGAWALTVGPLADGIYRITESMTDPSGFPLTPTDLFPALVVDTSAPRVAAFSVNAPASQVTVVFQDAGAGLNPVVLKNPAAYTLVSRHSPRGVNPSTVTLDPSVSGDYTTAVAVTLTFPGLKPGPGHSTLGVTSGGPSGISDAAGNALDGEFTGIFPSGDGNPGGNFLANFNAPGRPAPARPAPNHPQPHRHGHR